MFFFPLPVWLSLIACLHNVTNDPYSTKKKDPSIFGNEFSFPQLKLGPRPH